MFDINPTEAAPIWRQIEDGMRRMIALGSLRPGDAVPSVRDLARSLRVNPNTVARAYQRLTDGGVFAVRRGEGTFVADTPTQPKKSVRNEKLREGARVYAGTAIAVGTSLEDAVAELEISYEKLVTEHRRKA
ncbi:MAG: transcriptional regulator, GntR family [Acidobacteria bacterium]|nr:transcriptional regulator, GntR family [Acidobacteriota bacterium]